MSNRFLPQIEVWPPGRIEVPAVVVAVGQDDKAANRWPAPDTSDLPVGTPTQEMPIELSIRELVDLDVRDPKACTDFAFAYGVPAAFGASWSASHAAGIFSGLRKCALHVLATYRDEYVAPVWINPNNYATDEDWRAVLGNFADVELAGDADRSAEEAIAWRLLAGLLSHYAREAFDTVRIAQAERAVSLGCALALELRNIVADDPDPRYCVNCNRLFFVQRGTARHGQHRRQGEVRYCSDRCRHNHQERARYQRRKADQGKGN